VTSIREHFDPQIDSFECVRARSTPVACCQRTHKANSGGAGEEDFSDASPYDLLAAALASCTAMAVRVFAQCHQFPPERVEIEVSHRRRPGDTHDLLRAVLFLHGPLEEKQRLARPDYIKDLGMFIEETKDPRFR
jgi:organic hydroperoxide reductase OsmC/OhrA